MRSSAERFFRKTLNATHTQTPRVVNVDKNAAYPNVFDNLKANETLPETTELRQNKYLNNRIEQDHRFIKRLVNPGMGFSSFNTARRTLRGYEAMNMIRKGQILYRCSFHPGNVTNAEHEESFGKPTVACVDYPSCWKDSFSRKGLLATE